MAHYESLFTLNIRKQSGSKALFQKCHLHLNYSSTSFCLVNNQQYFGLAFPQLSINRRFFELIIRTRLLETTVDSVFLHQTTLGTISLKQSAPFTI